MIYSICALYSQVLSYDSPLLKHRVPFLRRCFDLDVESEGQGHPQEHISNM